MCQIVKVMMGKKEEPDGGFPKLCREDAVAAGKGDNV